MAKLNKETLRTACQDNPGQTIALGTDDVLALLDELDDALEDSSAGEHWRNLGLQFDAHRMQALWHLKALLQSREHESVAHDFLDSAPAQGGDLHAELEILRAEVETLQARLKASQLFRPAQEIKP